MKMHHFKNNFLNNVSNPSHNPAVNTILLNKCKQRCTLVYKSSLSEYFEMTTGLSVFLLNISF